MALYIAANKLLQQVIDLLSDHPECNEIYTKASIVMPGGTLGKHVRHVYDHFNLLFADYGGADWHVDYDKRARETPMENETMVAVNGYKEMQKMIQKAEREIPLNSPLTLHATIDPASSSKLSFQSTFDRELWYCCVHAIHHYAAIKAICIENGIQVPNEFGMAPSTIQYHQQQRNHL